MKFIILSDFYSLKTSVYILNCIVIILLTAIVQKFIGCEFNDELYSCIVGLNFKRDRDLYSIITFLLNIGVHILIMFKIFCKDFVSVNCNVFSRISVKRWIFYNHNLVFYSYFQKQFKLLRRS